MPAILAPDFPIENRGAGLPREGNSQFFPPSLLMCRIDPPLAPGTASHGTQIVPSARRNVLEIGMFPKPCFGAMIRGLVHVAPLSSLLRKSIARSCQPPSTAIPLK